MLKINDLHKTYDGTRYVLKGIHLEVGPKERVIVIGTSGAGKSTLIRCINQLVRPSKGEVIFEGVNLEQARGRQLKHLRSRIGMIFQHFNLIEGVSVLKNVLHGLLGRVTLGKSLLGLYSQDEKKEALHLLQQAGMAEHLYKKAGMLSGGQMQRVGICRALIQNPKLLLADEPIASLDPVSSEKIMELIVQMCEERSLACIINLHQVEFAKRFGTRIIGLKEGRIIFDGPPQSLTEEIIAEIYGGHDQDSGQGPVQEIPARIPLHEGNPLKKAASWFMVLSLIVLSFWYLGTNPLEVISSIPRMGSFLGANFWPPRFGNFQVQFRAVTETVLFAVAGTFISALLSFLLGILMTDQLNPCRPLRVLCRMLAALFRNIPVLVWATLVIYIFGIGPLVGLLALIMASLGFLARSYGESISDIAGTKLEAMRAVGAGYWQLIIHGLIPAFIPAWINWTLFSFEINIRASGILGMVGAGGLGLLIQTHLNLRNFRSAFGLILLLAAMVLLTEVLVNLIRRFLVRLERLELAPSKELFLKWGSGLGLLGLFFGAIIWLQLDFQRFWQRAGSAGHVLGLFFDFNPQALPEIFYQLLTSAALGLGSLVIGFAISLPLALLAADNTAIFLPLAAAIKGGVAFIRAIPTLIMLLMAAASLGFGPASAMVGLVFSSTGYLTKAFIATIEEVEPAVFETMTSLGAGWFQTIGEGVLPSVKSSFLAWLSIRLESNIADSISLGIIGAGGVGMLISRGLRQHHFANVTTTLTVIFLTLALLEAATSKLKQPKK